jgi:phosphoglycerate dehydrogenase-like enzyme
VGVIGAGWAGKHYIRLMNNFDVDILMYDPFISKEKAKEFGAEKAELEEVLKRSDILSIHAPSIPETYHMINKDTLKLMKKDAVLINTARGSIIDEKALYEHMVAGGLKYTCLDVTDPEPPAPDHPLRSLPNVIFTPHLAGLANNGGQKIGLHAAREVEKFLKGEKMDCEVTKEMLATMA